MLSVMRHLNSVNYFLWESDPTYSCLAGTLLIVTTLKVKGSFIVVHERPFDTRRMQFISIPN